MSDDLRTRIATAIWDALDRQQIVGFGPLGEIDTSGSDGIDMDAVADAVITELGLHPETVYAWKNHRSTPAGRRYVTKWEKPSHSG